MWQDLITILLPVVTGVAGWFVARRKKDNDFIHELQGSINMLIGENAKLLAELVEVKRQYAGIQAEIFGLKTENARLVKEVELLRSENNELHKDVAELNAKLENVKTITRTR